MTFSRTVVTTHTKTLVSPSSGTEDKVYGEDYVSASSHTSTGSVAGADVGGIPYFNSTNSEACSALLASGGVVLGGGAGGAPNTSANLTFNGTALTIANGTSTGLIVGAGAATTPSIQLGNNVGAQCGLYTASAGNTVDITLSGTRAHAFGNGLFLGLTSNAQASLILGTSANVNLSYIAANLAGIGTGAQGSFAGRLKLTSAIAAGVAVGSLNAAPTTGEVQSVTDALAPAVGVQVAAGGAAKALVWYNGAQWTVIGI